MKPSSFETYWQATSYTPSAYPPLDHDIEADVVILGGGITGLTSAMHLKNAGVRVVLLEAGRIGSGTTGATSGHLDAMPDQGMEKFIRDFGDSSARAVTLGRMVAIDQIEAWCEQFGIDCDFHRIDAFAYSESAEGAGELQRHYETVRRLGLEAATIEQTGLPFPNAGGLRIARQARFQPLRYLYALARQVHGGGCAVYENSQARPPKNETPCAVQTHGGKVTARHVILATHSAFLGISELDLRVAPYQSYVLAARVADDVPDALFWDDEKPYHYIRWASSDEPDLLLIGGADHKTGQGGDEREAMQRLEDYTRKRFHVQKIEYRWSAELFEPSDGLPYIGRVPFTKHLYVGTGYSGTGLTLGTVAGRLLADLVMGKESPLAQICSPSRIKPLAAGGRFLSENLNVARRFVADRFTGETIQSLDEIINGEGRLVRYQGKQWAMYRDEEGSLHVFSPACTHAGCHVQWNEFEHTWDCPCHGGRYSALGERIYGPPPNDLEPQPIEEFHAIAGNGHRLKR